MFLRGNIFSSRRSLLFFLISLSFVHSFVVVPATRRQISFTATNSNDNDNIVNNNKDEDDDDYEISFATRSTMSPYIKAFLDKERSEEEDYYTHMIGVPMSNCHQLQIELESVQKGILYNCPKLGTSCIIPSRSRMPLLYINAAGSEDDEVTEELEKIVNEVVAKQFYSSLKEYKEEDDNDTNYSGANKDGYSPLTMTFRNLQIDGKKHEVLYTVASDDDNDNGLTKFQSLIADLEIAIQSKKGWKTTWPSYDQVQGKEAKAMFDGKKYVPRIPIMRLPSNFAYTADDDQWDVDEGSDGISPMLWYKWKDDVLGKHVRLPEIGIYSANVPGNDVSEQNFYFPQCETIKLPEGNTALTQQEKAHQRYQDEKKGIITEDDNIVMDPNLSDNKKILESIYGKDFNSNSATTTTNEMEEAQENSIIIDNSSNRTPQKKDENEVIIDATTITTDNNDNDSKGEVFDNSSSDNDGENIIDNTPKASPKERFSAFMKQRVEDIKQGDTRSVEEWIEDPKYKDLYGDLITPISALNNNNKEDANFPSSLFGNQGDGEDPFRSYISSKVGGEEQLDAFDSMLFTKDKDGKSMQDRIGDLMQDRAKDIMSGGDKRPIEDWLDDPKNKGKYNKIIDPNVSSERGRIMEEEVDAIMNNNDDDTTTTLMDEFQGILQGKKNIGAESLKGDESIISSSSVPMKEKDTVAAAVVEEDMPFPRPVSNGTHIVYDTSEVSREEQIREIKRRNREKLMSEKPRSIQEWLKNGPKYNKTEVTDEATKKTTGTIDDDPPFPSEEALMGFWKVCYSPFNDPLDIPSKEEFKCDNFCLRADKQIAGGPVLLPKQKQKAGGGSWQMLSDDKEELEIRLFLPRRKEFTMVWKGEVTKGILGKETERAINFRDNLENTYRRTTPNNNQEGSTKKEAEIIIKCEGEVWMEDTATGKDREVLGPFLLTKSASLGDPDDFVYFIGDTEYKRDE